MEDYILQIRRYLPIKFPDAEANYFLGYLEDAYLENIKNKKYQFAFIAFHMLYMTFCYKTKWFLKLQDNQKVIQSLKEYISKRDKKAFFNILFDLARFSEKETFDCLLGALKGFNSNDIDNCKIHVTKRNHCAHANGKIEYNEKDIDYLISDELKYIEKIQNKMRPDLINFFDKFLNENWNKLLIGGDIENIFTNNNISRKDLEALIVLDLPLFKKKSDNEKVIFQKVLYLVFISIAQKYIDLRKNIFLERLPMFILGLKKEIKMNKNGEEKTISLQEIIEEYIVPIINDFEEKDRKEAEKILQL